MTRHTQSIAANDAATIAIIDLLVLSSCADCIDAPLRRTLLARLILWLGSFVGLAEGALMSSVVGRRVGTAVDSGLRGAGGSSPHQSSSKIPDVSPAAYRASALSAAVVLAFVLTANMPLHVRRAVMSISGRQF